MYIVYTQNKIHILFELLVVLNIIVIVNMTVRIVIGSLKVVLRNKCLDVSTLDKVDLVNSRGNVW